ncbi:MAG: hypothetical protein AB7V55_02355 [Oscillospiraceae bacterium]
MNQNPVGQVPPLPPPPGPRQEFTPPPGTYPTGNAPPAAPPVAVAPAPKPGPPPEPLEPPQRKRRVGTFTMALCLIAVGVLLILRLFISAISVAAIARFAPVVLVLLGIELLVANFLYKTDKLRFDILSVFLSLLLIGGSIVASVGGDVYYAHTRGSELNARAVETLNESGRAALDGAGVAYTSMRWQLDTFAHDYEAVTPSGDPKQLSPRQTVQLWMDLGGTYTSQAAFADVCEKALQALTPLVSHIDYVQVFGAGPAGGDGPMGAERYALNLTYRYEWQDNRGRLAELVQKEHWYPAGERYVDPAEREWLEQEGDWPGTGPAAEPDTSETVSGPVGDGDDSISVLPPAA